MEALNSQAIQAAHPGIQQHGHYAPSNQSANRDVVARSAFDLNMAAANLNAQSYYQHQAQMV
jgi:hypothetical protein